MTQSCYYPAKGNCQAKGDKRVLVKRALPRRGVIIIRSAFLVLLRDPHPDPVLFLFKAITTRTSTVLGTTPISRWRQAKPAKPPHLMRRMREYSAFIMRCYMRQRFWMCDRPRRVKVGNTRSIIKDGRTRYDSLLLLERVKKTNVRSECKVSLG